MADPLIIYGATGYSGRLLTDAMVARGIRPVLCGRNVSAVEAAAARHALPWRAAPVSDAERLAAAFDGAAVVLNAAGPFSTTAAPVVDACLAVGAHYLDITAEVPVIEAVARRHRELEAREVMAMPAIGFDVVPTDCLGAHLARRLPQATRLAIAVTGLEFITRGSAKTLLEAVNGGIVRRDGVVCEVPLGAVERVFDGEAGPRTCVNVSLGDVATAYWSTGIPNVETYVDGTPLIRWMLASCRAFGPVLGTAPMQAWLGAWADLLPADPSGEAPDERDRVMEIIADAEAPDGRRARSRLRTPEAYAFTAATGTEIVARVLAGDLEPGFQTPSRVYGSDFVLGFAGVTRTDVE
jgi:short subunit dehydrogenase-like uncharacterized protein